MEVRELQAEDKEAVREICKTVYSGNDFVPYKMDHWLATHHTGNNYPFVVCVDGNVVAVSNIKVMDGGTTAWLEGLRVHPDYRRKGIATYIKKWTMNYANEKLHTKKARYTTTDVNKAATNLAIASGLTTVSTMILYYLPAPAFHDLKFPTTPPVVDVPSTSTSTSTIPPITLQQLDVTTFTSLVRELTEEERHALIPLDLVVLDWTTYDVFHIEQATKETKFEIWAHVKENRKLCSFTVYVEVKVMAGFKAVPTIYCTDFGDLIYHVHHFHKMAIERSNSLFGSNEPTILKEKGSFILDMKICTNDKLPDAVLSEFFGKEHLERMLVWEKIF